MRRDQRLFLVVSLCLVSQIAYAQGLKEMTSKSLTQQVGLQIETLSHQSTLPRFDTSDSIAVFSSALLPYLEALGLEESITHIEEFSSVMSPELVGRINEGEVIELGKGGSFNEYGLLMTPPDLILSSSEEDLSSLSRYMIPIISIDIERGGWKERLSPLRYLAEIFSLTEEVELWFEQTEGEYTLLSDWAESVISSGVTPPVIEFTGDDPWLLSILKDTGAEIEVSLTDDQTNPGIRLVADDRWFFFDNRMNSAGYSDLDHSGLLHPQWVLEDLLMFLYTDNSLDDLYFMRAEEEGCYER